MPLALCNIGNYEVIQVIGNEKQHLEEMGLFVGENITIISKIGSGLIVQVGQTRLALDMKIAKKVLVK